MPAHDLGCQVLHLPEGLAVDLVRQRIPVLVVGVHLEMGMQPRLIDMDHQPRQVGFVPIGHGAGEIEEGRVLLVRCEPLKAQVCEVAEGDDAGE